MLCPMGSVLQVYIKCNLKIELVVNIPNWGLCFVVNMIPQVGRYRNR